jgi:hypothetical protein
MYLGAARPVVAATGTWVFPVVPGDLVLVVGDRAEHRVEQALELHQGIFEAQSKVRADQRVGTEAIDIVVIGLVEVVELPVRRRRPARLFQDSGLRVIGHRLFLSLNVTPSGKVMRSPGASSICALNAANHASTGSLA